MTLLSSLGLSATCHLSFPFSVLAFSSLLSLPWLFRCGERDRVDRFLFVWCLCGKLVMRMEAEVFLVFDIGMVVLLFLVCFYSHVGVTVPSLLVLRSLVGCE